MLAQNLVVHDSVPGLLSGIDYTYVQTSFAIFRQLTDYFPFVSIRPDADAISMATSRPLTTIAILTVSAGAQPELQKRLAQAFRLALSVRVIIQGERSLDMFVGLLIFLAWHQNHMANQAIYQMMCIVSGMAADLGLYQQPHKRDGADLAATLERERAFVGCYYLCSSLPATGLNKPSPIRWTDNLRTCAENVHYANVQASDRLTVSRLELARTAEELREAFSTVERPKERNLADIVEVQAKVINHRLKALKREHPKLDSTLSYAAAAIHFQYRSLRASPTPDTTTLIQCACAIKEYLDDILSRPPITLHRMSIVDWTNLLEILVLMAKISKPLPQSAGWEAGALASMLQPDAILDALSAHMAAAPVGDPLAPRHEAQLQWFRGLCDSIKKRMLHERSDSTSTLHSTGTVVEGRFRAVNQPYVFELPQPGIVDTSVKANAYDIFSLFESGTLDDSFWSSF